MLYMLYIVLYKKYIISIKIIISITNIYKHIEYILLYLHL